MASTVQVAPLVPPANIEIVTPASAAERVQPPAAGPAIAAAIPSPVEFTLANGLRVVMVEKHDLPLLTAALVTKGGGGANPAARDVLASLTADLLTKGTAPRAATQIAAEIEALGGSIDSDADWDGASVSVTVSPIRQRLRFASPADVARNPAFAADELAGARTGTGDRRCFAFDQGSGAACRPGRGARGVRQPALWPCTVRARLHRWRQSRVPIFALPIATPGARTARR